LEVAADLAVKGYCGICWVHVYEAQLRVEVASKEIEITHVTIDVVHLICSIHIKRYLLVRHNATKLHSRGGGGLIGLWPTLVKVFCASTKVTVWNPSHHVCKPAYLVPVPSQDKLGGLCQERHLA